MTKKENRTAGGAAERLEKVASNKASPVSKDNTSGGKMQPRFIIAELLPHGEENAVTTKELLRLTGYRERRDMTKQIERERLAGALILSKCSDGGGYYLPAEGAAGTEELRVFKRTLEARAKSTFRVLKAARSALKEREELLPRTEGEPNG